MVNFDWTEMEAKDPIQKVKKQLGTFSYLEFVQGFIYDI